MKGYINYIKERGALELNVFEDFEVEGNIFVSKMNFCGIEKNPCHMSHKLNSRKMKR